MKIGFCITGSFCTFGTIFPILADFAVAGEDLQVIFSENAYNLDTRFGQAADWASRAQIITNKDVWHTIAQVEPIGPAGLFDLLIVAPCTGNTLAKIAGGITDTCIAMAVKAQLRNEKPVLIGLSTNDALSGSAQNLGKLLNRRNIYFVPMGQDDPQNKPSSLVADFSLTLKAARAAASGLQLQPLLGGNPP